MWSRQKLKTNGKKDNIFKDFLSEKHTIFKDWYHENILFLKTKCLRMRTSVCHTCNPVKNTGEKD